MATRLTRALLATKLATTTFVPKSSSFLFRLRPLVAAAPVSYLRRLAPALCTRGFSTRQTTTSLNDPNPNWSNRPPKETILLDGCDFEHWLVVLEKPEGDPTRDEIIDSYIKTLATIVGSEEEARMKIYSVSTRHYFAFGALVNEELSYKLKELPQVRWVLPDSYLDVRNKDYGGEPFIDGQAVPYDPKYHEEWVRNNARANERNRRNDRPRNFDRSRNFDRRNPGPPNDGGPGGNMGGQPSNTGGGMPPHNMGGQSSNDRGMPPNYGGGVQPPNNTRNYPPTRGTPYQHGQGTNTNFNPNMGSGPAPNPSFSPNMGPNPNISPNPGYGGGPNQGSYVPNPRPGPGPNPSGYAQNMGPVPVHNQSGYAPNSGGGPNMGPGPVQNQNGYAPNSGGGPNMGPGPVQNHNGYAPNSGGGNPYQNQNQNVPGRDFPHPPSY